MIPVLQAVPNFSEGRDPDLVRAIVDTAARSGADVLDWSSDPDHNRSVLTLIGSPSVVEDACVELARVAKERIRLDAHEGVHPRVGALDVVPLVPLHDLDMDDARASARRVGKRIAELGIPVWWYAESAPRPRTLAQLRKGGFEALVEGRHDVPIDLHAGLGGRPHPSAGVTCVGARKVLLAWNVYVDGLTMGPLKQIAGALREGAGAAAASDAPCPDIPDGGFPGLRTLAIHLESTDRYQISMNLEDLDRTAPLDVFRAIEGAVEACGGRVAATEVIGMIPETLVLAAAADRLQLLEPHPSRRLSARLSSHITKRASAALEALLRAVEEAGDATPRSVREVADRVGSSDAYPRDSERPT